jgi:hypothetical protein
MDENILHILADMKILEAKLEDELKKQEQAVRYKIKNSFVEFEQEIIDEQRKNMKNLFAYLREVPPIHLLVSPVVYAMIIPALVVDLVLFIYQHTIFRIFKLPLIKRSDYIVFDRQYLSYLNIIEKVNCLYCSYFNGLMAFALEIAAQTELYFCPIKHAKKTAYKHSRYDYFLTYGAGAGYHDKLEEIRTKLTGRQDVSVS